MSLRNGRVARMAEQAVGQFIPREQLEQRLAALAATDPKALPVFAARCVLRAFPVLALGSNFNCWQEEERTRNLLRVWRALLSVWSGDTVVSVLINDVIGVVEHTKGALAGGADSSLQGEVLRWSMLVSAAEKAARVGSDVSTTEQVTLASTAAEYSHNFLFHVGQQNAVMVTWQDVELCESGGSDRLRQSSLWLSVTPSPRLHEIVFEHLPRALQELANFEQSRDSRIAGLLERIWTLYRKLFERGIPATEVQDDLLTLAQYFLNPAILSSTGSTTNKTVPSSGAPVSPPQPTPRRPATKASAPGPAPIQSSPAANVSESVHEPWDETQMVKPITELENIAQPRNVTQTIVAPSPAEETLFQEFRIEKTEVDPLLLRELSYRPSDRHSIEQISEVDHLNRGKLVHALATVLAAPGNDSHQTIGLLGDWGVGKSTLVHLLKNELVQRQQQQPFLFAEFNAWAYEHTDNLQAGIAQEMLKALSSDLPRPKPAHVEPENFLEKINQKIGDGWSNVSARLVWYYKRFLLTCQFAIALKPARIFWLLVMLLIALSPFAIGDADQVLTALLFPADSSKDVNSGLALGKGVAAAVGTSLWILGFIYYFATRLKDVLANPLAKELLTYLKLPDYGEHLGAIPVMRKNIEALCRVRLTARSKKHKDKRLLFVVDDLDRCDHEGIVKVLEAVRLVLDLKRVTVIIAVDQRIALAALALHYKELAEHHQSQNPRAIARDYLAKVLHLPILLSPPDDGSIAGYLNYIWQEQAGADAASLPQMFGKESADQPSPPTEKPNASAELSESIQAVEAVTNPSNVIPFPQAPNALASSDDAAAPTSKSDEIAAAESTTNKPEPKQVPGLSTPQKKAFLHWVKHFRLINPRQLKRLHNSYNLLRHYYGEDTAGAASTTPGAAQALHFPLMVTLFALESLNSLDDPPLRAQLKARLRGHSTVVTQDGDAMDVDALPFDTTVVSLVNRRMPERNLHLVDAVEPFVLPAIEQEISQVSPAAEKNG